MCVLTEVIRQKENANFVDVLNRARIGVITDADLQLLNSRQVDVQQVAYICTTVYSQNAPKDAFNLARLEALTSVSFEAIDSFLAVVTEPPFNVCNIVLRLVVAIAPKKLDVFT